MNAAAQSTSEYHDQKIKGVVREGTNPLRKPRKVGATSPIYEVSSSFEEKNYDLTETKQENLIIYKKDIQLPEVSGRADQCYLEDVTSLYRKHLGFIPDHQKR